MNKMVNFLFTVTGAKFYFDWILITNWSSKNPIIKFLWNNQITYLNYNRRIFFCYLYFLIHLYFSIVYYFDDISFITNLIVNIYPMIIQLWIGYRIFLIVKHKNEQKQIKNN